MSNTSNPTRILVSTKHAFSPFQKNEEEESERGEGGWMKTNNKPRHTARFPIYGYQRRLDFDKVNTGFSLVEKTSEKAR